MGLVARKPASSEFATRQDSAQLQRLAKILKACIELVYY